MTHPPLSFRPFHSPAIRAGIRSGRFSLRVGDGCRTWGIWGTGIFLLLVGCSSERADRGMAPSSESHGGHREVVSEDMQSAASSVAETATAPPVAPGPTPVAEPSPAPTIARDSRQFTPSIADSELAASQDYAAAPQDYAASQQYAAEAMAPMTMRMAAPMAAPEAAPTAAHLQELPAGATHSPEAGYATVSVFYATDRARDPLSLEAYQLSGGGSQ